MKLNAISCINLENHDMVGYCGHDRWNFLSVWYLGLHFCRYNRFTSGYCFTR